MTNPKKSKTIIHVGVDAGKWFLDVCTHEKASHWQEDNSPEGIKRILKRLAHYEVKLLAIQATGRYEFALAEAAFTVCIAKPLSVRRYAGAVEQLVKTDKIDTAISAEYAAVLKLRAIPRKSKNLIFIKDLHTRRR